jgi:hypothetical protein
MVKYLTITPRLVRESKTNNRKSSAEEWKEGRK